MAMDDLLIQAFHDGFAFLISEHSITATLMRKGRHSDSILLISFQQIAASPLETNIQRLSVVHHADLFRQSITSTHRLHHRSTRPKFD